MEELPCLEQGQTLAQNTANYSIKRLIFGCRDIFSLARTCSSLGEKFKHLTEL